MLRLNDQQIHQISRKLETLGFRKSDAEDYLHFATGRKDPAMTPGRRQNIERDVSRLISSRRKDTVGWVKDKTKDRYNLIDATSGCIVVDLDGKPIHPPSKPDDPLYTVVSSSEVMLFIEENEGLIQHMYLDSKSHVTIGIGHLIPNEAAAKKLSLKTRASPSRAATDQEKIDEFRTLQKLGTPGNDNNNAASFYKKYTKLFIEKGDARNDFRKDYEKHKNDANGLFPLNCMPRDMQIAFIDLVYQRGAGTNKQGQSFKQEYIKFSDAIRRGDWAEAGRQANPRGNDNRNRKRADRGRKAAKEAPFFVPKHGKTIKLPDLLAKIS